MSGSRHGRACALSFGSLSRIVKTITEKRASDLCVRLMGWYGGIFGFVIVDLCSQIFAVKHYSPIKPAFEACARYDNRGLLLIPSTLLSGLIDIPIFETTPIAKPSVVAVRVLVLSKAPFSR